MIFFVVVDLKKSKTQIVSRQDIGRTSQKDIDRRRQFAIHLFTKKKIPKATTSGGQSIGHRMMMMILMMMIMKSIQNMLFFIQNQRGQQADSTASLSRMNRTVSQLLKNSWK
jgi:hypothetical protein